MTLTRIINQFRKNPDHIIPNIMMRFPQAKSPQKHIFVVGAPRSGTTLMKLILAVHPNLTGIGYETGFFMYKDLLNFNLSGLDTWEKEEVQKKSADIIQLFDNWTEKLLLKVGGRRFIEKTPPHVLKLDFLLKYFPSAQFINIYRDGRDCYCSARNHQYVVQGQSLTKYAKYWKKCVKARLKRGQQANIFDVKYEDLVTQPEKIVKEIMIFLGEQYDPKQIQPAYYSQHQITKSKRQEFSKLSQSIDASNIYKYKHKLSPAEITKFNKIAGTELQKLGYEL